MFNNIIKSNAKLRKEIFFYVFHSITAIWQFISTTKLCLAFKSFFPKLRGNQNVISYQKIVRLNTIASFEFLGRKAKK